MTDPWERVRQIAGDEHAAYFEELAASAEDRPLDHEISAETMALNARRDALTARYLSGGIGDLDLRGEFELLLHDFEALRDRCPPDGRDRESLQYFANQLMGALGGITSQQGQKGRARDWYTRAAAGWLLMGDQAAANDSRLKAAQAAVADGADVDATVTDLESELADKPPVRRAAVLVSTARILFNAGDHFAAQQRVGEAAGLLNAAGLTDPMAAGSAEGALTAWLDSGYREAMSGARWQQLPFLLVVVAVTWGNIITLRFRLGASPFEQTEPVRKDLLALVERLYKETEDIGKRNPAVHEPTDPPPDGETPSHAANSSFPQNIDRRNRLIALLAAYRRAGQGGAGPDDLLAGLANLELEASQAGDVWTASQAASERVAVLFPAGRIAEAEAVTAAALGRFRDADGLNTARRHALLVDFQVWAALIADKQRNVPLVSQLCGDAIAGFERERAEVHEPYLQDSYLRQRTKLYQLGVLAAWQLDDHELTLARADLTKARGCLAWAAAPSAPADGAPSAQIALLRAEWSRLADAEDGPDTINWRRTVWSRLMTAQSRVSRTVAPPALEVAALQAALAPDEAIIYYYFVGPEALLIYVITPTAVGGEVRVIEKARGRIDQLAAEIVKFGDAEEPGLERLDRDLSQLSEWLLPRDNAHLLEHARRLLICPHRILHHLPLHALDWRDGPLIERFAVSYVPNATSLLLTRPAAPSPGILSVGLGAFPSPLPPIPGAEQEAADIAAIYQRRGIPAKALQGANASRASLERLRADGGLERFAVLHLATHGDDILPEEPGEAALHLADGRVDAMEISQWTLRADLVALSACWSGRRPVHGRVAGSGSPGQTPAAQAEELFGDEIYGLQAAFFAAGARQILGSMWPVSDRPAAIVMKAFHAGLAAAQPPEIALQTAISQRRRAGWAAGHWAPYKLTVLGRIGQTAG